jgi:hypothetical protein
MGDLPPTAHDIRAAAEVHAELGPEYSDAVVESFLAKLDSQIDARVDERLASLPAGRRPRPADPLALSRWRYALGGGVAGSLLAGVPLSVIAVHAMTGTGDSAKVLWAWVPPVIIGALAAYRLRRQR